MASATTSLQLDAELKERIQRLATVHRCAPQSSLLEAIEQYVVREEQKEKFSQDTLEAWNEYQQTGLHVTAEEADAWLDRLASGEAAEPPICHV